MLVTPVVTMAGAKNDERWYFNDEQLKQTPSIKSGMTIDDELMFRKNGAVFIETICNEIHHQRMKMRPLVINTAIVYFHRFFMFQSFRKYNIYDIATCCVLLAAKFEDHRIHIENLIRVSYSEWQKIIRNDRISKPKPISNDLFAHRLEQLLNNENLLLLTLGFNLSIEHPHSVILYANIKDNIIPAQITHIACHIATELLKKTILCLKHRAKLVACVCIQLAAKHVNTPISQSFDDCNWMMKIDANVNIETVDEIVNKYGNCISIPSDLMLNVPVSGVKRLHSNSESPDSAYLSNSPNSNGSPQDDESLSGDPIVSIPCVDTAAKILDDPNPKRLKINHTNGGNSFPKIPKNSTDSLIVPRVNKALNNVPSKISSSASSVLKSHSNVASKSSDVNLVKVESVTRKAHKTNIKLNCVDSEKSIENGYDQNTAKSFPLSDEKTNDSVSGLSNGKSSNLSRFSIQKSFSITFNNDKFKNTSDSSNPIPLEKIINLGCNSRVVRSVTDKKLQLN